MDEVGGASGTDAAADANTDANAAAEPNADPAEAEEEVIGEMRPSLLLRP